MTVTLKKVLLVDGVDTVVHIRLLIMDLRSFVHWTLDGREIPGVSLRACIALRSAAGAATSLA